MSRLSIVSGMNTLGEKVIRVPVRASRTARRTRRRAGHEVHRFGVGARVPRVRTPADEDDLGAVADVLDLADLLREDRARVVAPHALGVAAIQHREADVGVQPAFRIEHELGIGGEPGRELEAGRLGDLP